MKTKLLIGVIRGWHLIGAGPARYGYARVHPCCLEWLGYTKAQALSALNGTP